MGEATPMGQAGIWISKAEESERRGDYDLAQGQWRTAYGRIGYLAFNSQNGSILDMAKKCFKEIDRLKPLAELQRKLDIDPEDMLEYVKCGTIEGAVELIKKEYGIED